MSIPTRFDFNEEELFFEKILLEMDEKLSTLYGDIFKLYCSNCEGPQQMEVVDLLNAKRYVYFNKKAEVGTR